MNKNQVSQGKTVDVTGDQDSRLDNPPYIAPCPGELVLMASAAFYDVFNATESEIKVINNSSVNFSYSLDAQ